MVQIFQTVSLRMFNERLTVSPKLANATKANIALTAIEHYRLTKSLDELQSEPLCYVLICLKNIYAQAKDEADAIRIPEINKQEIEAIDAAFDGKIKGSKPATIHLLKL